MLLLVAASLAAAACGGRADSDAGPMTAGTAIPMGAPGAQSIPVAATPRTGVIAAADEDDDGTPTGAKPHHVPAPTAEPLPPDPFAPPATADPDPPPVPIHKHPKKPKGTHM